MEWIVTVVSSCRKSTLVSSEADWNNVAVLLKQEFILDEYEPFDDYLEMVWTHVWSDV